MKKKTDSGQVLHGVQDPAESDIDTSEQTEIRDWSGAVCGRFWRPLKQSMTIRLDADIIAWFKASESGGGYQTSINRALREYITQHRAMPGTAEAAGPHD